MLPAFCGKPLKGFLHKTVAGLLLFRYLIPLKQFMQSDLFSTDLALIKIKENDSVYKKIDRNRERECPFVVDHIPMLLLIHQNVLKQQIHIQPAAAGQLYGKCHISKYTPKRFCLP